MFNFKQLYKTSYVTLYDAPIGVDFVFEIGILVHVMFGYIRFILSPIWKTVPRNI